PERASEASVLSFAVPLLGLGARTPPSRAVQVPLCAPASVELGARAVATSNCVVVPKVDPARRADLVRRGTTKPPRWVMQGGVATGWAWVRRHRSVSVGQCHVADGPPEARMEPRCQARQIDRGTYKECSRGPRTETPRS